MEILPGIHQLRFHISPEVWGACYLLLGRRPALVDSGEAGTPLQVLLPYLDKIGLPLQEIALIVSTHRHSDHAGGLAPLRAMEPIPIAAHALEVPFLEDPFREVEEMRARYPDDHPYCGLSQEQIRGQLPGPVAVDIHLQDGDEIELGDWNWRVVHTPGHCSGIIALFQEDSSLLLAADSFQASGTAGGIAYYHDLPAYLSTLDRLEGLDARALAVAHPFQPFNQPLFQDEEVTEFVAFCRHFPQEYNQELSDILRSTAQPCPLGWITDALRALRRCDGPRFLTVATVRTHLDRLSARGILRPVTLDDHPAWSLA